MKREIPWPYSFPIKISTAEGFKLPLKPTSKTSSTHQNGSPCMNSPKKSPPGLRTVAEGDLTLQLMRGHKKNPSTDTTGYFLSRIDRSGSPFSWIGTNTAAKTERDTGNIVNFHCIFCTSSGSLPAFIFRASLAYLQ